MFLRKAFILTIGAGLSILGQAFGISLVQSDGTFVAFKAELGSLNDAPSNGSKFDGMAPAGGSLGDYLSMKTTSGTVSFDVVFLDNEFYTVYARPREETSKTPSIDLTFNGATSTSTLNVAPSTQFAWVHLPGADFTPAGTPGLIETVTFTATGGADAGYDAFALEKRSAVNGGGFSVNDTTISQGQLSIPIPEPSTLLLLLLGQIPLFLRRRAL